MARVDQNPRQRLHSRTKSAKQQTASLLAGENPFRRMRRYQSQHPATTFGEFMTQRSVLVGIAQPRFHRNTIWPANKGLEKVAYGAIIEVPEASIRVFPNCPPSTSDYNFRRYFSEIAMLVKAAVTSEVAGSGLVQETELRRIYVIDDDASILKIIQMQLESEGYDVVLYSLSSEFLDDLPDLEPGIVVSDQCMPMVEGLDIQVALQDRSPRLPMILLSGVPETRVSVQAMRQGAITVLDKPFRKSELVSAVLEAFDVLRHSLSSADTLPPQLPDGGRYLDRLSARERQVVDEVYKGETNKSVGIRLAISIKTVEKHRGKAMKKMEVESLAQLVRMMDRELR